MVLDGNRSLSFNPYRLASGGRNSGDPSLSSYTLLSLEGNFQLSTFGNGIHPCRGNHFFVERKRGIHLCRGNESHQLELRLSSRGGLGVGGIPSIIRGLIT